MVAKWRIRNIAVHQPMMQNDRLERGKITQKSKSERLTKSVDFIEASEVGDEESLDSILVLYLK